MDTGNDNFEGLSLGEQLRAHREAMGMSVDAVAREIKIASQYVRALEEGDWRAFSAKVYAQGAARRMARVFKGVDAAALAALCGREWDSAAGGGGKVNYSVPRAVAMPRRFMLTPRRLGGAAAAGTTIMLIAFLSIRLITFTAAPTLTIQSPADESLFTTPIVEVSGKTEKESSLTVNGREITLDEYGNFNEAIALPSGTNELHFISRNRFGKTQTAVRTILVK